MSASELKSALHTIDLSPGSIPVRFVRVRKARRYILRVEAGGIARITIPRGGSLEYAWEFARRNIPWLRKQLQRDQADWRHGAVVLLRGVPTSLLVNGAAGTLGPFSFRIDSDKPLRAQVEAFLQQIAAPELAARTKELAALHGLEVRKIVVRGQRTRWGSCSSKKTICLNWRLMQTPDTVRDYIIIHELMHLREMNHSPRFWSHVAAACPHYKEAERWLRKHSQLLR